MILEKATDNNISVNERAMKNIDSFVDDRAIATQVKLMYFIHVIVPPPSLHFNAEGPNTIGLHNVFFKCPVSFKTLN